MKDLVKFRWHRGGFDESMATMTIQEGEDLVQMIFDKTNGHDQKMSCKYQGYDPRQGWSDNVFIVTLDGKPVGYANKGISHKPSEPPNNEFLSRLERATTLPVYDPQPWYDQVDAVMKTFKEFIEGAFKYLKVEQVDTNKWIVYEEAPERHSHVLTVTSLLVMPKAKITGFIEDTEVIMPMQLEDVLVEVIENVRKEGLIELCTRSAEAT